MIATTRETRDKVAAIICSHGASPDTAELILYDIAGIGIHLIEVEPPPVPYTGEKAAEDSTTKQQAIERARAAIRGAHYTEEHQS